MYMIIRYLDPWGLLLEKDHGFTVRFEDFSSWSAVWSQAQRVYGLVVGFGFRT